MHSTHTACGYVCIYMHRTHTAWERNDAGMPAATYMYTYVYVCGAHIQPVDVCIYVCITHTTRTVYTCMRNKHTARGYVYICMHQTHNTHRVYMYAEQHTQHTLCTHVCITHTEPVDMCTSVCIKHTQPVDMCTYVCITHTAWSRHDAGIREATYS